VKDPRQIERGQRISLVAQTAGLEVRMKGEALEDGVAGERIQVRNVSTRRVIDGVVLSATTVRVSM
jgi:flagella basal body P-ring formation protein FlgA